MSAFAIEADLTISCLPFHEMMKSSMTPRGFSPFFDLVKGVKVSSTCLTFKLVNVCRLCLLNNDLVSTIFGQHPQKKFPTFNTSLIHSS